MNASIHCLALMSRPARRSVRRRRFCHAALAARLAELQKTAAPSGWIWRGFWRAAPLRLDKPMESRQDDAGLGPARTDEIGGQLAALRSPRQGDRGHEKVRALEGRQNSSISRPCRLVFRPSVQADLADGRHLRRAGCMHAREPFSLLVIDPLAGCCLAMESAA